MAPSRSGCDACKGGAPEFPAGLRVLVVDDDATTLRIIEQMSIRCRYRVTTCTEATVALNLLRERKGCFDVVLSDVHMPDMDGYKLLEHVGLEMDLPVIMMSGDSTTSAVMKGIRHGACDYLIKPVREEELRNIWQHVVRKIWNENKEHDNSGSMEDSDWNKRGNDDTEYTSSVADAAEVVKGPKKRSSLKEEDIELESDDPATSKKPRVVWSVELHQQFVSAVNQLGLDKAVPKRILELMNVPGLTRENVASHLQKFRLYLKRLSGVAQQQNGMLNAVPGTIESKLSATGRFDIQALAAAGHVPPETLAALHAELLGCPASNIMSTMDQATLLQASIGLKHSHAEHAVAYGQPLVKRPNIGTDFLPSVLTANDVSSGYGAWPSSNNTMGSVRPNNSVERVGTQNNNILMDILDHQQRQLPQQKQQHHHQQKQQQQQQHHHQQVKLGASIPPDNLASKLSETGLLYDGQSIHSPTNAALVLENIKQEVESLDADYLEEKTSYSTRRRLSADFPGVDPGFDSVRYSLKACKTEGDTLGDGADTIFTLFASLLDSSLQGLMPIADLILRVENACRNVSESIRYGLNVRHRVVEDKLMRQKAQLLLDEAATWSLLWFLYGKGTEELSKDQILVSGTSHVVACEFVAEDHTAQLCLRIVQWLEGLASKALDLEAKVRGSHVGSYLPNCGVWHHTQRYLKKGTLDMNVVHHLDFDAPTRENANLLPDDKKQDESLLEDVWTLLRAGRLEEACGLCRSAGQPWRASSIYPFGGLKQFPSVEVLVKNGKNRTLQAVEFESGIGHQWHLWKWASYCASEKIAEQGGKCEAAVYAAQCSNLKRMLPLCNDWESACWAMAKSWLDVQVDLEITRSLPGGVDQLRTFGDVIDGSPGHADGSFEPSNGPENWPIQVLNQQPRQLSSLLQKLHSGEMIHESVTRQCKEQQRQIQMTLMLGDIPRVLDLIWSWIAPTEDNQNVFRPCGDPQMIRFGAHLVLVLRYLLAEEMKDTFKDKILSVGDNILHLYALFLFSKEHEELVGIYASQLACHRCIDLFVHMMELRLHSSVHVKYKIFLSAMEYLPFSSVDDSKGNFEDITERILARSREIKVGKYDNLSDVAEQHRLQSLQKAKVIQWLCFTPPSTITNVKDVSKKLLLRALVHSNILFREFALISMWRVPAMPIGAHTVLGFLAEPLKQFAEALETSEDYNVFEDLREFQDWREYYSCDATYRNWLKIEVENAEVPVTELSLEEKERSISAAKETLKASLSLLQRKETPWLASTGRMYESAEPVFLELHATAMLCLPSGECLCPDATVCTTLTSALYSSAGDEVVLNRQLMVNVSISSRDSYCIDVVLRCLAIPDDGLEPHELNDGGILGTILASGFKGELPRFQAGVTMEISRLDAWYSDKDGPLECPATYIVKGLCRRCCLPEVILRCMQVSVSLMGSGVLPDCHDTLIELVGSPETDFLHLFSQQQLQEFLLFEREYSICKMEITEE